MYLKGLKRAELNAQQCPKQARPMTKEVLAQLIAHLNDTTPSLRMWRTVWRLNIAFYGLLRWDDVKRLQVSDFSEQFVSGERRYLYSLKGGKSLMFQKDKSR
jgi:hypothetical protein